MSMVKCENCCRDIDTDITDMVVYLDKYHYCESCVDRDEIFEKLDEMQEEIDSQKKRYRVCNRSWQMMHEKTRGIVEQLTKELSQWKQ